MIYDAGLPVKVMEYPRADMMEYLFPLRGDVTVRLVLPRDLTSAEVRRLERFMMALVNDDEEAQREEAQG